MREYCKAMREAGEAWKEAFRANALRHYGKEKSDLLHFVVEGTGKNFFATLIQL